MKDKKVILNLTKNFNLVFDDLENIDVIFKTQLKKFVCISENLFFHKFKKNTYYFSFLNQLYYLRFVPNFEQEQEIKFNLVHNNLIIKSFKLKINIKRR